MDDARFCSSFGSALFPFGALGTDNLYKLICASVPKLADKQISRADRDAAEELVAQCAATEGKTGGPEAPLDDPFIANLAQSAVVNIRSSLAARNSSTSVGSERVPIKDIYLAFFVALQHDAPPAPSYNHVSWPAQRLLAKAISKRLSQFYCDRSRELNKSVEPSHSPVVLAFQQWSDAIVRAQREARVLARENNKQKRDSQSIVRAVRDRVPLSTTSDERGDENAALAEQAVTDLLDVVLFKSCAVFAQISELAVCLLKTSSREINSLFQNEQSVQLNRKFLFIYLFILK